VKRTRRHFLKTTGGLAAVGLTAGCTDSGDGRRTDDGDRGADGTDTDGTTGGTERRERAATGDGVATSDSGSSTSLAESYPNAWAVDEEFGIVVLSADAVVERFGSTISGEVVNASDEDYDYVQLSFSLLDDRDTKIADALANTSGLRAGQRWRYEAVGRSSPDITTFRLTEITAY